MYDKEERIQAAEAEHRMREDYIDQLREEHKDTQLDAEREWQDKENLRIARAKDQCYDRMVTALQIINQMMNGIDRVAVDHRIPQELRVSLNQHCHVIRQRVDSIRKFQGDNDLPRL